MRRLLSIILLAIISAMTINAGVLDDKCREIADALRAGDVDDAEDRATDAVSRYDYVLKAIDCHKSAVAKDADAAANRYRSAGYNMDAIIADYKAHLSDYRNAVSESMNF